MAAVNYNWTEMVRVYRITLWLLVLVLLAAGCRSEGPLDMARSRASATPWQVGGLPTRTDAAPAAAGSTVLVKTPVQLDGTEAPTGTPQPTGSPLPTATATPEPVYGFLRGKVIVDQANCRYGPGWPYLYKYGVYRDSVLELIGRNAAGTWVLIRGVGGTNACWVKASLLQIRGDVMTLAPTDTTLPASPYYGPLSGVQAERQGEVVTVSWNPLYLRAGDDSEQTPYVVEAWVCQEGQLVFIPYGAYTTHINIRDEWGCAELSHARVTAAEKHGYTAFVEVTWPFALPSDQE
jgi:hypothetical protein